MGHAYNEHGAGQLMADRGPTGDSAHDKGRHTGASRVWGSRASDIGTECMAGKDKKIRERGAGTTGNKAGWVRNTEGGPRDCAGKMGEVSPAAPRQRSSGIPKGGDGEGRGPLRRPFG